MNSYMPSVRCLHTNVQVPSNPDRAGMLAVPSSRIDPGIGSSAIRFHLLPSYPTPMTRASTIRLPKPFSRSASSRPRSPFQGASFQQFFSTPECSLPTEPPLAPYIPFRTKPPTQYRPSKPTCRFHDALAIANPRPTRPGQVTH